MRHTQVTSLAAVATLSLAAGCGSLLDGGDCTTIALPGIVLQVVDSATGGPIVSPGGIVTARSRGVTDSARFGPVDERLPRLELSLAFERTGTYEVAVRAEGYRPWSRADVRVTFGECHVRTQRLTARLQRAP